jgi:archaemetzincin
MKPPTILFNQVVPEQKVGWLKSDLENYLELSLSVEKMDLDLSFAYRGDRNQYSAEKILKHLKDLSQKNETLLLILPFDLFIHTLHFVYGSCLPREKLAVVSYFRLDPTYYAHPKNDSLFRQRLFKEALHELGHIWKLGHCSNPSCVMFFSNTLVDTDYKPAEYCPFCLKHLCREI